MDAADLPQRTRLKMTRCSLGADGQPTLEAETFTTLINPAEIGFARTISYSQQKVIGQLGSDLRFSAIQPEKLNFNLVLDGTGAVPGPRQGVAPRAVADQLKDLLAVVYRYDSALNEPSRVQLLWGSLVFYGRMTSMSTNYTLFKPNGDPLRAKIQLAFQRFLSAGEAVLMTDPAPTATTRTEEAQPGETLPQFCQRVYGDAGYAAGIARVNGLSSLLTLPRGTTLVCPPLRG
jgi:Contractile injection system tube protein